MSAREGWRRRPLPELADDERDRVATGGDETPAAPADLLPARAPGDDPGPGVTLLTGPPAAVRRVAAAWAADLGVEPTAGPGRAGLLELPRGVPAFAPPPAGTPVVVPRLEDLFLRHAHGIAPLRESLSRLAARAGVVLAAGYWTYRYLDLTIELSRFCRRVEVVVPPAREPPAEAEDLDGVLPAEAGVRDGRRTAPFSLLFDLLIHGDLAAETAEAISPMSRGEVRAAGAALRACGVVGAAAGRLAIAPRYRAAVVHTLVTHGWITDEP